MAIHGLEKVSASVYVTELSNDNKIITIKPLTLKYKLNINNNLSLSIYRKFFYLEIEMEKKKKMVLEFFYYL